MTINTLVVRVADPEALCAALRALGIEMRGPDRANPAGWLGRLDLPLAVLPAAGGLTGWSLRTGDLDRLAHDLGAAGLRPRDASGGEGRRLAVELDPSARIVLEEGEGPARRPTSDLGLRPFVAFYLARGRARILAAVERGGASNPRLAGPSLAGLPETAGFSLVVDGPGCDLDAIQRAIDEVREGHVPTVARRAGDFDPERLAAIDRLAWDL